MKNSLVCTHYNVRFMSVCVYIYTVAANFKTDGAKQVKETGWI